MAVLAQASLGTMRVNAARLNYHNVLCYVKINSTSRQNNVRREGFTIRQTVNSSPDTCTMRVWGFTPSVLQDVKVYIGSTAGTELIFGGNIQRITQVAEGAQASVAYDLECVDYSWFLDRRLVFKSYTSLSATAVAQDIISSFTSGYTSSNVQPGLPLVNISFVGIPVSQALTQLAQIVGGHWKILPNKDLRFVTTSTIGLPDPDTLTASNMTMDSPFTAVSDGSQVRTRVYAIGKGTTALATTGSGSAVLPVEDTTLFTTGAAVVAGAQLTYTGVSPSTGSIAGIPMTPWGSPVFNGNGAGSLSLGYYTYAVTYTSAAGETTIGVRMTATHATGGQSIILKNIPVGPQGVQTRKLYRCTAQVNAVDVVTATLSLVTTLSDNSTSDYTDGLADGSLGANAPSSDTSLLVDTTQKIPMNSTSIGLVSTSAFSSTGGWAIAGSVAPFSYTGKTSTTLTGIPASGAGSLTGDLSYGTTCVTAPLLTGIPTSGTGSIAQTVNVGDPVRPYLQVDDATAQTALAAIEGGDGIHEAVIDDETLVTDAMRNAAAVAELTLFKAVENQNTFSARDYKLQCGAMVTLNVGAPTSVSGTRTIQSVTISQIGLPTTTTYIPALRTVEVGTTRLTLPEYLRQLGLGS